jgi:hypothetical protein
MLKPLVAALALAATCALFACSHEDSQPEETEEAQQPVSVADLTGRWAFVYDADRKAAVEAEISKKVSDPKERAAAFEEAAREAAASEVEFTADGEYISRIDDKEIFRAPPLEVERVDGRTLHTKPMKGGKIPSIALTLVNDDTLVMTDPHKGDLTFRRVK